VLYSDVEQVLREAVPEFGPVIDEHIAFNDELLPHVLFGDLTRFVLVAHDQGNEELVRRCLVFLDEALREGDAMLENLVAVSFVENVEPWDPAMTRFIESWPAGLRQEAEEQRDWTPGDNAK